MYRKFVFLILIIELSLLFSLPVKSSAREANISDILITNTQENLLVYFQVEGCFTKKMEEAILAGIPTTFTFTMELYRVRNNWKDKKESMAEIKNTIKYDNVKKIFFVSSTETGRKPEQFKSFEKAKIAMSDVNGTIITPLKLLEMENKYYIRVKAELDKVRLPLHLEYVFFFVSLWNFETDWLRQDFAY
jgi:hypothetical protein